MKTRDLVLIALCTALIAVSGRIAVPLPFTSVPFTAQVLAVALTGMVLSPLASFCAVALYVAIGLIGLPVFSFGGGMGSFAQPTFGFVLGFLVMAPLTGILSGRRPAMVRFLVAGLVGLVPLYLIGVLWLQSKVPGMTFAKAMAAGCYPFVGFDALKILIASLAAPMLWRVARGIQPA